MKQIDQPVIKAELADMYQQNAEQEAAAELEDAAIQEVMVEDLERQAVADRQMMLRGFDPETGVRYTRAQYRELIEVLEPTPEERHLVFMQLSMRSDFELDFLEDEERRAWQAHDGYSAPTREQDIAWLQEIGDANIAAMIAAESSR